MEPTTPVYVIREFIWERSRFAPSSRPYLYGELPKHVRDNRDFVIPVDNAVVKSEVITNVTELTPIEGERVLHQETLVIEEKAEVVVEDVQASEVVQEEATSVVEEVLAPAPTSRKRR